MITVLLPVLLLSSFCWSSTSAGDTTSEDYTGYKLIRFKADRKISEWLDDLESNAIEIDEATGRRLVHIDVWGEATKQNEVADVLVNPEFFPIFRKQLEARGVQEIQILKNDIQKDIQREKNDLQRIRRKRQIMGQRGFDPEIYHSYDEMVNYMKDVARGNPNLVTLLNVTKTYEGRTIYGVKISRSNGSAFKPSIFLDAGVHAREWIAPATALYIIHKMVKGYDSDEKIRRSIDKFDWYILPQVNPDGYEYSRTSDRLWRKTRSKNVTVNKWCIGADANRNWGYRWGEGGANRSPCSNIYGGSHPFSEIEIKGMRDFITWYVPNMVVYASLHAYGQLFLAPWGYTKTKPANYEDQQNAARAAVNAMRNTTGSVYHYGTISELMYPASGTSIDYMQNKSVPYIYGIELRPTDTPDSHGFNISPQFIKPTGEEMLAGMLALSDYAAFHKKL